MLSNICRELKNWFDRGLPKMYGKFEIRDGKLVDHVFTEIIKPNQYFRIIDSTFNDGVYKYTPSLELTDETFEGSIWLMAIPNEILDLADEIAAWAEKYDDAINSPFQSESFGGYSYTKGASTAASDRGSVSWQSQFAAKLNMWRKI